MRDESTDSSQRERDRRLLERAQAGDRRAFDALVSHYGAVVLAVARSIVRARGDAEDVAQEAFLRLYKTLARIDPERPLEPWIVKLTVNAARSHASRNPARRESSIESAAEYEAGRGNPHSDMEAADARRVLREAADALTEREREVFLLRDVQGLPVALIAEALAVAPVTVRRLSSNGRAKVVAWIREHRPEMLARLGGKPREP